MGVTKNLVLGGSGTIGAALCTHLAERGEEVVNLDLRNGHDLRTCSLAEYAEVDYVWFLAWEVGGAKFLANPDRQHDILLSNVQLCARVFEFLEKSRLPFLFTSSQLAAPDTAYGITKLLGEQLALSLGGTVVRFWNVYGWEEPGEKSHVMTDMILQALTGRTIRLMTNGQEERQFIYIDDCVRNLCLIRDAGNHDIIHLTNGRWMSILDVAHAVAEEFGAIAEPGPVKGYQHKIDPDVTHRAFAWPTSLQEGIRRVGDQARHYLKDHSNAFKVT